MLLCVMDFMIGWTRGFLGPPLVSVCLWGGGLILFVSCGGRGYGWVHNSLMLPHSLIRGRVCILVGN